MRRKPAIILVLFLLGLVAIHLVIAWNSRDLVRKGYPDFTIFYSAGKIVRDGLGSYLYDQKTQYRVQQEFASGVSIRQGPLPYNHPPFEALLFVPFTFIPYFTAYLLWDAVNLVILLRLPFLLRPHLPGLQRTPVAAWLLVALAFYPLVIAFLQGQDVILLLLLFALGFGSLKRGTYFAAGCWLGLGLFRFHLVLPVVLILLLRKKWKAVAGFAAVAVALALISIAVSGWQATLHYPSDVLHMEQAMAQHRTVVPIGMPNLRGLLTTVIPPGTFTVVPEMVIALTSIALVCFAASRWKSSSRAAFNLGFCLCVIVTVLVGYHAFAYDLSLLLVPIALLADYLLENPGISGGRRILLLGPLVLLFLTPLHMLLSLRTNRYSLMALILLLWFWGISREVRQWSEANP